MFSFLISKIPSGFLRPDPSFAKSLLWEMPTETVMYSPISDRILCLIFFP